MNDIIMWCNDNNGFLTAIFSAVGLLLSLIAIYVSIRTARLPYKKALKLSVSTNIYIAQNILTDNVESQFAGMSVNAANIGARNINITYLGIAVKKGKEIKKLTKIREKMTGEGIIEPTDIHTNSYSGEDLIYWLNKVSKKAIVYAFANDSEGKSYKRKIGLAGRLAKNLSNL